MRKIILAAPLLVAGCLNQGNESIDIPFAVLATDELQAPAPGTPCIWAPVTQAGGVFRSDGFVELDTAINSSPEYVLGLQVENDLDNTVIVDSNGNPVDGPQRNEFHVQNALIKYLPQQSYLSGNGMPQAATILVSGAFQPIGGAGGTQGAGVMVLNTLSGAAVQALEANLAPTSGNTQGDLVLQIQLNGVLGSGEAASSGTFFFPLHVCYDCFGIGPTAYPSQGIAACPAGTELVVEGHGACCSNQDFSAACMSCGGKGEPCCSGGPACINAAGATQTTSCLPLLTPAIGTEFCPGNAAPAEIAFSNACQ